MQMAISAAGSRLAEADELRQAMAAKRSQERMARLRQRSTTAWPPPGITGEVADRIWEKLSAFASYGFPESHSVSFAYLVYASSWLKRFYPAAFCAGLLDAQPMGFYSPHTLVQDARRHGVEARTPDLNASGAGATLEWGPPEFRAARRPHREPGPPAGPSPRASTGGRPRLAGPGARAARPAAGAGAARRRRGVGGAAVRLGLGLGAVGGRRLAGASWPSARPTAPTPTPTTWPGGCRGSPPPSSRPWPRRGRSPASGWTGAGRLWVAGAVAEVATDRLDGIVTGTRAPAAGHVRTRAGPGRPVGHRGQPEGHPTRFLRDALDDLGVVTADGLASWRR